MPTTLNRANSELVAVAFLKAILGQTGGVGTKLPGDQSSWAATGFAQVAGVGGSPNPYAPLRRPVVGVTAWAVAPGSKQPPWNVAADLAERIVAGCYGAYQSPVEAILPAGFERAFVQSAYALTEPRRIGADDSSFARFVFDLQVNWVGGGI
jgi:hypothetical protein